MSMTIDLNAKASSDDGIFGLPFKEKEAKVVYIPVPWDVTTSYGNGTHKGPKAMLKASAQIDFFDLDYVDAFKTGLHMTKENAAIKKLNIESRKLAEKIINSSDAEIAKSKTLQKTREKVNAASAKLNDYVYKETKRLLSQDKISVLVGGDHSTPFGAIKAYAEKYPDMGILHFDAHSDTRHEYMGFTDSHASIMNNVIRKIPQVSKLVQVGIRDFCQEEYEFIQKSKKIKTFFDMELAERKLKGENFISIAKDIVKELPDLVYLSFDIDGLEPRFCPSTGTPVPGGLDYYELVHIVKEIVNAKKTIVGFDLVEVAPSGVKGDEWDANVGMRLLYKLTSATLASQKIIAKR